MSSLAPLVGDQAHLTEDEPGHLTGCPVLLGFEQEDAAPKAVRITADPPQVRDRNGPVDLRRRDIHAFA
jgi:hypothetical protein